jgi:membrane-bound serine protease (ClpP class)
MRVRSALALAMFAALLSLGPATAGAASSGGRPLVIAITLSSEINPVSASFVSDSIDQAKSEHAAALVIELNTPGGLGSSMDDIVDDELNSPVPVIVYVSPEGARAASAGAVITMASDLAIMAPTTHIGAATPIDSSGQNIGSDLRRKVVNDSRAQMLSLAQDHGRNPVLAQRIVTQATEYTAQQAVADNLVEGIAPNLTALLNSVDGTTTTYTQKPIVLHTANAEVESFGMPWTLQLLNILIDPNVLYLIFLAGIVGLAYEVLNPGVILPGTIGVVCLILALFGFSTVPINWAGAALIVFGVFLLLLEGFVTSHGLIAISGIVALTVGGLLLFRTQGSLGETSPLLVIGIGALLGGLLAVVVTKVMAARHQPISAYGGGAAALLGQTAIARTALAPEGQVMVHGELWRAHIDDDVRVAAGDPVVINEVDGLVLHVKPRVAATDPEGAHP